MGTKGEELASKFSATNGDFMSFLDGLNDAQWQKTSEGGEGWPIGVTAHHVAESLVPITAWVQASATGGESNPPTPEELDKMNAEHAKRAAGVTKAETLALLRQNGDAASSMLRGLSDEQLATNVFLPFINKDAPASQLTEMALVGHIGMHAAGLKSAAS